MCYLHPSTSDSDASCSHAETPQGSDAWESLRMTPSEDILVHQPCNSPDISSRLFFFFLARPSTMIIIRSSSAVKGDGEDVTWPAAVTACCCFHIAGFLSLVFATGSSDEALIYIYISLSSLININEFRTARSCHLDLEAFDSPEETCLCRSSTKRSPFRNGRQFSSLDRRAFCFSRFVSRFI